MINIMKKKRTAHTVGAGILEIASG